MSQKHTADRWTLTWLYVLTHWTTWAKIKLSFEWVMRHCWDSSPHMSLYSAFIAARTSAGKVAHCIWATGGWGELGCHRNGIGRMAGRVFFMTAFARQRAWHQGFIVRHKYWISIAGQGIWIVNGHHSTTVGVEWICFRPKMDSTWANVAWSAQTNSAHESWYSTETSWRQLGW